MITYQSISGWWYISRRRFPLAMLKALW